MSTSKIEQIRVRLEDVQIKTKVIANALSLKAQNRRQSVMADHVINNYIKQIQQNSQQIIDLRSDSKHNFILQNEIMKGTIRHPQYNAFNLSPSDSPPEIQEEQEEENDDNTLGLVFDNFYTDLKKITKYNLDNKLTNDLVEVPLDQQLVFQNALGSAWQYFQKQFTAEQNKGKCLDMNSLYLEYQNLPKINKISQIQFSDYVHYLQNFDKFNQIPLYLKDKKYISYIKHIAKYLGDFIKKTQPLTDFQQVEMSISNQFEHQWEQGTLFGWQQIIANGRFKPENEEACKDALFCIPCSKKFTNQNVFNHHKKSQKHVQNVNQYVKKKQANQLIELKVDDSYEKKNKKIAILEFFVTRMKDQVADIISDTINQIRKKQSRNYNEIAMEYEDDGGRMHQIQFDDQEEDNQKVYNPKDLPTGWDGKPIPYWLYKLHGLGIEYKCEICGGASYWGRRAFEKHFQQWRHAFGMKCLRVPNTMHFRDVTKITDALNLHQKILRDNYTNSFNPDYQEEFEDSDGNVLKRKQFADLLKQGLI